MGRTSGDKRPLSYVQVNCGTLKEQYRHITGKLVYYIQFQRSSIPQVSETFPKVFSLFI